MKLCDINRSVLVFLRHCIAYVAHVGPGPVSLLYKSEFNLQKTAVTMTSSAVRTL